MRFNRGSLPKGLEKEQEQMKNREKGSKVFPKDWIRNKSKVKLELNEKKVSTVFPTERKRS